MVEVGKCYYFIIHAYHHVIAEVVEITGKREADVKNVRWIYSSRLSWSDFFENGPTKTNTTYHYFPDGGITWIAEFDWNHPIPE